jgi:hypothetical protein
MKKYRFKTKEECIKDGLWTYSEITPEGGYPKIWNSEGEMNKYLGEEIPTQFSKRIKMKRDFILGNWFFTYDYCVEIKELTEEELKESLEIFKTLIPKKMKTKEEKKVEAQIIVEKSNIEEKFVFMDKTISILNVGFLTNKNVVLFGPGE